MKQCKSTWNEELTKKQNLDHGENHPSRVEILPEISKFGHKDMFNRGRLVVVRPLYL